MCVAALIGNTAEHDDECSTEESEESDESDEEEQYDGGCGTGTEAGGERRRRVLGLSARFKPRCCTLCRGGVMRWVRRFCGVPCCAVGFRPLCRGRGYVEPERGGA